LEYRAIDVDPGQFPAAAETYREGGGRGLNVTAPFKRDAWVYCDDFGLRAERAGAVNPIVFRETGRSFGDNTDGAGLVRDLTINHAAAIRGKSILLLGAGGAARGVLHPLLAEVPGRLVIANRTIDKATDLALMFGDAGDVFGCAFDELPRGAFDLIINATAAGLENEVPPVPEWVIAEHSWCYDLMYADLPTAFVRWGRNHGAAKAMDGLGMLVEQAAESFFIWRGVRPDTAPVIAALRAPPAAHRRR
jgi:shikimate dehydrogenase